MSKEEVIAEITAEPKYYAGKCEQSYASNTVRSIKAGTCKPDTEKAFFKLFGYTIISPVQYDKV
jgi:hypothetical protein